MYVADDTSEQKSFFIVYGCGDEATYTESSIHRKVLCHPQRPVKNTLETTNTHATFHKLSQLCRIAFATNYFPALYFFVPFCLWSHGDLRLGVLIEIRYKIIKRQLR